MTDSRQRILLIDDDPDLAVQVEVYFLPAPTYHAVPVTTLTEGLRRISDRSERWTCILLDLRLPPYDGLDGLRALVAGKPTAPIIVLSGSNVADLELEAIRLGADSAMGKTGLSPDGLQTAIRKASARWAAATRSDRASEFMDAMLNAFAAEAEARQEDRQTVAQLQADLAALRTELDRKGLTELLKGLNTEEGRKIAGKAFVAFLRILAAGAAGGGVIAGAQSALGG